MASVRQLQQDIHKYAVEKGWWSDLDGVDVTSALYRAFISEKLLLIDTEIAEAMEEVRKGNPYTFVYSVGTPKPEGFGVELADAVIRILDLCGFLDIDIQTLIDDKMAYNITRPYKHGDRRA